jgi:hypothetical protein
VGKSVHFAHSDEVKQKEITLTGVQFTTILSVSRDFSKLIKPRKKGLSKIEDYKIVFSEDAKAYYVYFGPLLGEINGGDVKYTVSKQDYSIQKRLIYR